MTEKPKAQVLMGGVGSPYTRKMLAVMRFRNIPYRFERQSRLFDDGGGNPHFPRRAQPKVPLLPTFYFEDEAGEEVAVTDSTPIIRRLEEEHEGRSVIPSDPVLAFVDLLLEDFGDEWLTKAMFHYRWYYEADIEKAGDILPLHGAVSTADAQHQTMAKFVRERQISRLPYVGSNETTRPTIEASFERFVGLLDRHLTRLPFLMGERPGSCDFAVYGQLTCLALFDPTPQAYVLAHHPRVYAWVESLEDLSGYGVSERDWLDVDNAPETLVDLLGEVGRIYLPYLVGNARAVAEGADRVRMTLDGRPWEQDPFPYHVKCLRWLREATARLVDRDRARLAAVLAGTGCEVLVSDGGR